MKKLIILFLSVFAIFVSSTAVLSIEISNLKPSCCCDTDCHCEHERSSKTIIRNIKCGDNGSATLTNQTLKNLVVTAESNDNIQTAISSLYLNTLYNDTLISIIDPPPPKFNLV